MLIIFRTLRTDYVGEVSVSGLIDKEKHGMTESSSKFPPGVSIVKASEIADTLWNMVVERRQCEVLIGDVAELGPTIK